MSAIKTMLYNVCVYDSEFERSASGLLTELYNTDPDMSTDLVTRQLDTWNGINVFKLAQDMDSIEFMTHDCIQAKVDEIWRGKIPTNTPMWLVGQRFLSCIIMHFILAFSYFLDHPRSGVIYITYRYM